MRRLLWFALPFGAGCALCCCLLPGSLRLWAAAAALAVWPASLPLSGRAGRIARCAALGCAAGILWCSGYAALYLAPAEELAGTRHVFELELAGYPEEASSGARCEVRLDGLRGRAVYYGGRDLLDLEPGNRITARCSCYSAASLAGEESGYYVAKGVFLRLYGGETLAVSAGNAGSWRYLPARLARWLRESGDALYSPRTRGLVAALLTGERDGLDPQSYTDLSEAGLLHLTAVSGLHCGFLISLLGALVFRRRRLTAFLAYPVLLFYAAAAGGTPSVARACVMAGLMLLAPLVGREGDPPTSLSAALLAVLLANPFAVASVSLQLSFSSVAGLLVFGKKIYRALTGSRAEKGPGRLRRLLAASLSASLGVMLSTAPLCAAYFGTLSLAAPLANLLTLWMAPALFAGALAATTLGGAFPALAGLAAVPEGLARYLLGAAHLLAKLPGHSVCFTRPAATAWLAGTYALLGLCLLVRGKRWKWGAALAASLLCLLAVKAGPGIRVKNDRLTAVAVDVGQGAATLFHSGGRTALVDCGSLSGGRAAGWAVAAVMDTYGWDRLDYVVLTHYHADHAGGLPWLLARTDAEQLLLPRLRDGGGEEEREVLELAAEHGAAVRYIGSPRSLPLGDAALAVYPPVSEGGGNEEGLTVLCTAGEFDVLATGDMGAATEEKLAGLYGLPDVEVLLAGHHGSKYAASEALLEAVTPEVGVISVGRNTFGHPAPETLERMAAAGMTVRRTDEEGDVVIRVE